MREPAGRAARVAALQLLARVRENRDRLDGAPDPEALHDFRVSTRRLRSWLRAFGGLLDDTLSDKSQRRLQRIAHATGASRDLEVHLAWVRERRPTLRGELRRGADWLIDNLERRKIACDLDLKQKIDSEFDRTVERIERAMSSYASSVVDPEARFAQVAARLLRRQASAVSKALRLVGTIGDRAEAHEARIAAKRLRYLLDPLDRALPDVKSIVDDLGQLQDQLGQLHDAQLFGSEIATSVAELLAAQAGVVAPPPAPPPAAKGKRKRAPASTDDAIPGLLALARRLRKVEEAAFRTVKTTWLGKGIGPVLTRVEGVALALDAIAREGRELDRRYALTALPPDMPPASMSEVDLGFMSGEQIEEQIRRERPTDAAETRYYRTLNAGDGVGRVMLETVVDERTFDALWPLTKGRRVRARRHRLEVDGWMWELFELTDRSLVLAVVQVQTGDNVPPVPEWLTPVIDKDVSGDEKFAMRSLAK